MSLHAVRESPTALGGQRLLVVEDEAFVAMLIEDLLLEAGAEVVGTAASIGEALQLIDAASRHGGLSAAVLDLNLGGESVKPVADRLAAIGVPFVFCTGYGEGCYTYGYAVPVVPKPFNPDTLVTTVISLTPVHN